MSRPRVEVCFTPNLYPLHIEDEYEIVVAIDVLRATTAICTAFEYGVSKIIPVSTLDEAIEYREKGYIVAAERKGQIVSGFELGNSPYSYMNPKFKGKTIVLTTTNGTKAINTAKQVDSLVIGSLVNLDAICKYLLDMNKSVLLLGSGWKNKFCLEDTICAGAIADNLLKTGNFVSLNGLDNVVSEILYHIISALSSNIN